ncbi:MULTISPECIES: glutaredoxin family protein [Paenibacillus]|uniref:glutaredoxin family protein n=1 Tax=Paenibacillus TaxID=44249 RepID=UPI000380CEFF|nr:glutaredoxin family protein [Paenibacillus terrigena]
MADNNVIVYSRNYCPHCVQVKKYLEENNVAFEERNVDTNEAYMEELFNLGMRAVPVTVVGEEKILGFNTTQLKQVLSI